MKRAGELGTRWLNFLYGFFIFQCVVLPFSVISVIHQIIEYKYLYGSTYGMSGIAVISFVLVVIRFIIKVCACRTKFTKTGYGLFMASLVIDAIVTTVNGFSQSPIVGIGSAVIAIAVFAPNAVYVTNRRELYIPISEEEVPEADFSYAPSESPLSVSEEEIQIPARPVFCRRCGVKLNEGSRFCSKCGTKTEV